MKKLIILLSLAGCTSISHSQSLNIFDTDITLTDGCNINITRKSVNTIYKVPFSQIGQCRIVAHDNTNVSNIQYINGMYLFFIENNISENNACRSEYTAIGISNNGQLYTTEHIKRSSTCHQGRESKSFEIYSNLLKPHTTNK